MAVSHDRIQRELAEYLQAQIGAGTIPERATVCLEDPGSRGGSEQGRPDVTVRMDSLDFAGFAFVVRTLGSSTERMRVLDQAGRYMWAGFRTVLVAPKEFYEATTEVDPNLHPVGYPRLLRALRTDIVEVRTDPDNRFRPVPTQSRPPLPRWFGN